MRFVVISSDVVYPTGAMSDYEAKFWLPFKGVDKPVYAIPGNHDWYDALETLRRHVSRAGRRARGHARACRVRPAAHQHDRRPDRGAHSEAARLRSEYGVPTGFQRAPFFEIQTDRSRCSPSTPGSLERVDADRSAWLEPRCGAPPARRSWRSSGIPFYAGGHDCHDGDAEFARLKRLLRDHDVSIVMAGDTHDLEYYLEHAAGARRRRTTSSTAAAAPT